MRGQTKAQVENRSRENAATGVTNVCLRPVNCRACHNNYPMPAIGLISMIIMISKGKQKCSSACATTKVSRDTYNG